MNQQFYTRPFDWVSPTFLVFNNLPEPQFINGQIVPTLGEYVEPYPQNTFTEITTVTVG